MGGERISVYLRCAKNCCLLRSGLGFPYGEAGAPIGSSEPIGVTEEVWYRVNIRNAVGKKQHFGVPSIYSSVFNVVTVA